MSKQIQIGELILGYKIFGTGERTVLALHGHSKSPEDFNGFQQSNTRVVALELFHHGSSYFPPKRINKKPINESEWLALMELLFEKENFNDFHLVAYSQGGRFALKTYELFPKMVVVSHFFLLTALT